MHVLPATLKRMLHRLPAVSGVAIVVVSCLFAGGVLAQPAGAPVGIPAEPNPPNAGAPNVLPVAPPVLPNSATVTLAPGDSITISVFGRPELTSTVYVADGGTIDVPLAGSIPVAGLSPAVAAERVATAYREGEYLIDPQVNIVLAGLRSQQISILGEVVRPGRIPIDTRTTILDALAQAGGVTPRGEQKAFILRRREGGVDRFEVDLRDLFDKGSGQVVDLRAGDTILVPKAPLVYLYGEVAKPGSYALRGDMTVIEAITEAGGITPRGSTRRIQIKRKDKGGKPQMLDAEIDDTLRAEDIVNVRERIF